MKTPLQRSHVLYTNLRKTYRVVDRGEGVYLYDRDGRRYLDAAGGAAVTSIGHSVPEIIDEIKQQLDRVTYVARGQFTSQPTEDLATQLIDLAPSQFGRVFFVSGGSEATETAIKLARKYHVDRGEPQRTKTLSRWQSYHGGTLGALAATGHAGRRHDYAAMLPSGGHIAPIYCYRCPFGLTHPSCRTICADDLERAILDEGPETVSAFIAEPVVMTIGVVSPVPEYFKRIREICDRYGVVFIADEVITGFWRTGPAFAMQRWNVIPDMITCGKGISSGYTALGAVLVRDSIVEALQSGSGQFNHGYTLGGNPLSTATGLAVLRYIQKNRLFERVEPLGAQLLAALSKVAARHPIVGEVRGAGLLIGMELVRSRESRAPFMPSLQVAQRVADKAAGRGVLLYPVSGSLPRGLGDYLMIAPAFTIDDRHSDEIVSAVDASLDDVEREIAP